MELVKRRTQRGGFNDRTRQQATMLGDLVGTKFGTGSERLRKFPNQPPLFFRTVSEQSTCKFAIFGKFSQILARPNHHNNT